MRWRWRDVAAGAVLVAAVVGMGCEGRSQRQSEITPTAPAAEGRYRVMRPSGAEALLREINTWAARGCEVVIYAQYTVIMDCEPTK